MKNVCAILLVAGNSTRFGQNFNKNFAIVNNKPILAYSLEVMDNSPLINSIVIVVREKDEELVNDLISKMNLTKEVRITYGGRTRQESVYNGLSICGNPDIVLIHDGARPCIKEEYINECVLAMEYYKGVTMGVNVKDTIKVTDDNGVVEMTTKRDNTWSIQTPQCFDFKTLFELHNRYRDNINTDDCMILEHDNVPVKVIEGEYTNIKVTTYSDLAIVESFLKNK